MQRAAGLFAHWPPGNACTTQRNTGTVLSLLLKCLREEEILRMEERKQGVRGKAFYTPCASAKGVGSLAVSRLQHTSCARLSSCTPQHLQLKLTVGLKLFQAYLVAWNSILNCTVCACLSV